MSFEGVLRFGRYAFPPNELGYCGPDDHDALLGYVVSNRADMGMVELGRRFEGAYPYLKLIAESNGFADPFDVRVVEAYWIGNSLLHGVNPSAFRDSLQERFRSRMRPEAMRWLAAKPGEGATPHHNFHVFEVYTRAGLMNGDAGGGPLLETMDACRISWGRVVDVRPGELAVQRQPLKLVAGKLTLGAPEIVKATAADGYIALARRGDAVSMHWSWACEVLTASELARLQAMTAAALAACNQTI